MTTAWPTLASAWATIRDHGAMAALLQLSGRSVQRLLSSVASATSEVPAAASNWYGARVGLSSATLPRCRRHVTAWCGRRVGGGGPETGLWLYCLLDAVVAVYLQDDVGILG
jgi:hypothetical protein